MQTQGSRTDFGCLEVKHEAFEVPGTKTIQEVQHRILTSKDQGPSQGQDSSPQERMTPEQHKHLALGVLSCAGVFSRCGSGPGKHAIIWFLEGGDKMETGNAEKARS